MTYLPTRKCLRCKWYWACKKWEQHITAFSSFTDTCFTPALLTDILLFPPKTFHLTLLYSFKLMWIDVVCPQDGSSRNVGWRVRVRVMNRFLLLYISCLLHSVGAYISHYHSFFSSPTTTLLIQMFTRQHFILFKQTCISYFCHLTLLKTFLRLFLFFLCLLIIIIILKHCFFYVTDMFELIQRLLISTL